MDPNPHPGFPGLAYLVAEFPAPNHNYLYGEIAGLRAAGLAVHVVSVRRSSQPLARLSVALREEANRTEYLKATSLLSAIFIVFRYAVIHPIRFSAALRFAIKVGGWRGIFYVAEAALLGHWMRRHALRHVHAHFAATVALLAAKLFPEIGASFTAHGYGEFYS